MGCGRGLEHREQRLSDASAGHRDWHNDYAELLLEIDGALEAAADKKAKAVILRRIRQSLKDEARE